MSRRSFACALLLAVVGCGSDTRTNTTSPTANITSPTPVPQHGPYTLSGTVRHSRDYSEVDWMFLAGVSSYISGEVNFGVRPNRTGAERSGTIVVGEARWTVKQDF